MKGHFLNLESTTCKRCGRPVMTLCKPIHGTEETKAKYGGICSRCMTKEEEAEMLQEMGRGIAARLSNR